MVTFSGGLISDVEVSIDESAIIDYVVDNYDPEDIYPKAQLEEWAEANGYAKEDKNA